MNQYELTLVLPAKSKSKEKAISEKIEKQVKTLEGKVTKSENWGEIELSYPIAKEKSGIYLYFELELEGKSVKALSEKLRMDEEIIRYLLIRKEDKKK